MKETQAAHQHSSSPLHLVARSSSPQLCYAPRIECDGLIKILLCLMPQRCGTIHLPVAMNSSCCVLSASKMRSAMTFCSGVALTSLSGCTMSAALRFTFLML